MTPTWFVAGFLVVVVAERMRATFTKHGVDSGQKQMSWSLYGFYTLYTLIVVGSFAERCLVQRPFVVWISVAGVVMYVFSTILRNTAIRALGRFWSLQIEIRQQHQLVREGVYGYVRHPIYAAIVLEVLSIPLVAQAWWTLLFALCTHVPLLMFRLSREEKAMVDKFGDTYRQYQREVGALCPRLWGMKRRANLM